MKVIKIGRSPENDIVISETFISRQHALLMVDNSGKIRIRDLDSTSGTYVNGNRIQEEALALDDDIRLGNYRLDVRSCLESAASIREDSPPVPAGDIWKTITIGRNPSNTIVLPFADVSGEHAVLTVFKNGEVLLKDKQSMNGTKVNGVAVTQKKLVKGDTVMLSASHQVQWEEAVYGKSKKKLLIPAIAAVVLLLCGIGLFFMKEKMMPVSVVEKYANSVVIIRNDYVYEVDLEGAGSGVILGIGWSGCWAAQFDLAKEGGIRAKAGLLATHLILHPGEEIRTPLIAWLFWKGKDVVSAQNLWRRWYIAHNMPRVNGQTQSAITQIQVGGGEADIANAKAFLDAGIRPEKR